MKRFYKFLMPLVAIVAMALPWNVQAQVTCDSGSPVTVSNTDTSTTTTSYMPGYSLYNYSFSEVLILADDLMGLGEIKALQFKPASTSAGNYFNNCEIYLANTELEDLSSGFFDDASELELVWSGNMNYTTTDWQTIVFDDPFAWDGSSNIVVAVRRNHGSWTSGSSFAAFSATAQLARYAYQDSGPYTIGSLPSGTASSTVAWYKLIGCESSGPVCYRVRNLEASNITSDGVTLSWVDTLNSGVTYTIYNMADTSFVATTSSTTYTLTGLTANTAYQFGVMADCGSSYVKVSIRTACSGYAEIPYIEDFESESTGENPPCWLQLSTGSSGSGTFPAIYVYPGNTHNGQGYFEFESASGTEIEMVALPTMQDISGLKMLFWASSSSSYSCALEVGVLESDGSFTRVDSVPLITFSGTSGWKQNYHEYTVYFSGYTGSGERIAMRASRPSSGQYTLFIDDLRVVEDNGCYPVVSVNAADIDSSSVTLTWTDTMNVGISYTVSYWTDGGDTTVVSGISDTTYTALNLNANTTYSFMVTTNCTTGDGLPTVAQFRTGCGTTAIPYTEGFEGLPTAVAPSCWTVLSGNPRVMTTVPHTGSQHLYFSGAQPNTIALPRMGQPTNELQVRFWTRPESYTSSSCGSFSVGYMTDITDDSTFVELANWAYNTFSAYEEKEVPMVGAPDTAYIVLRHNSGATNWYWYVDDLVVEPIPTCAHPVSVIASNITPSSADLTIHGTGSSYRVYFTDGTTLDSVDITDSVYTLSTLNFSTDYTVTVVTLCDDGSITSAVSTSFRTPCAEGGCEVLISMDDSFGDGWNGNAINGIVNGVNTFTATLTGGSTGTYSYSLCAVDTLLLKWNSGNYSYEASFVVTAGGAVIAFGNGDDFSSGDTLAFTIGCPTCATPSNFTVSNITTDSATIAWTAGDSETEWEVIVDSNVFIVNNNFLVLSGLNTNTYYSVAIRAICDEGDTSTAIINGFRTACGLMSIPYTEDFEGMTEDVAPVCWDVLSGNPTTYNYSTNAHSGNNFLHFSGAQPNTIVLPEMSQPTGTLQVRFWTRPESYTSSSCGSFSVGYMTDINVDSTFVELANWAYNEFSAYEEKEVPMVGAPNDARIVFRHNSASSIYYWYVDDLTVELAPVCPRPRTLTATTVTDNQIDVAFAGSASGDYIVYITDGAAYSDSAIVTSDSIHSFTGLTPLTNYTISVVADCGTEVSPARTINVTTTMLAEVLPVNTGFEVGQDTSWLLVNGTQLNQWVIDAAANNGGSRALYISSDNGVTNDYDVTNLSNVYATKLLNFATAGDYAVSYDWRAYGESNYDYLRVFLVPGTVELTAGDNSDISTTGAPTGWLSLDGGSKLNLSSSWQTYSDVFSVSTPGNYNLVFFWHNDNSVGTQPSAAVDNVHLAALSCSAPTDVTVSDITASSATISWTPSGDEAQWEVSVNGVNALVSSTTYTATGLTSSTNYNVSVRAVCGAGDTSFATSASFTTALCDNASIIVNYDTAAASTNSSYCPVGYSYYNYGYVQTIVSAERLSSLGGDITALAFNTASATAGDRFNNMTVYMANVSEDSLADGFIHPDASHLFVKVIDSANFSYTTTGWQIHGFDTPFQWDGTSNVLVSVKRDHGSYASGSSFVAHEDNVKRTRYAYRDSGGPYDINSVDGGTASFTVGDLQLISCGDACFAPAVTVSNVADASVTLTWTGSASAYQVAAVAGIWAAPAAGTPVTGLTHTVTGLAPATQYAIGVRAVCDEGVYSEWNVVTVTTADHPCYAPTNVSASNITMDGATISWTPSEEGQTNFELRYSTAGDTTVVSVTENPYTLTGLLNATEYSVAVRAICGENNYSDWSAPYTFRTASCQVVQGVTVSDKTASTATIEWTDNGSASYEVGYGPIGTTTDNCTRRTTTTNSYTITGLEEGTNYVVYVRSICGSGVYSDWTSGTTFTTREVGIDDVEGAAISLYPNPASSTVTLTGIEGDATVTVVDMNGRVVKVIGYGLEVIDNSLTIDISELAQGAYFVRITGERVNAIRKLIVR
jgi:hypothetical protein